MNNLSTNLKTLLDKLCIDLRIRSVEDMHKVQRAVYEESKHGIDLGYYFHTKFNHYPSGKFSPELRDVHIELNNYLV